MSRPAARDPGRALAARHPEWRPWLDLLAVTERAAGDRTWSKAVPAPGETIPDGAPLLTGATIVLEGAPLRRWGRELVETAARRGGPAATLRGLADGDAAGALMQAAIDGDATALEASARTAGADSDALRAVASLLAVPFLRACARAWAARVPPGWRHGYCPVCGAWPSLVEARGLERSRRLRCGRCGGDWETDWLRCPFCGNGDHRRLGSLVGAASGETRKVDTCLDCRGYLKTLTSLSARSAAEVALDDLATVDLDVAALEHGYRRPERPARPLGVRVTVGGGRRRSLFAWRS